MTDTERVARLLCEARHRRMVREAGATRTEEQILEWVDLSWQDSRHTEPAKDITAAGLTVLPIESDKATGALLPCPFCGSGETEVKENFMWQGGHRPSSLISVEVLHWCGKTQGMLSRRNVIMAGWDRESAIAAWNYRAAYRAAVKGKA